MLVARGLAAAIVASLLLALVPGADWGFQLVYPLFFALGAATTTWWPILLALVLSPWAGLDYAIEPYDIAQNDSADSAAAAALYGLFYATPIAAVAFAVGKLLRAFALALGSHNAPPA